MKKLTAIEEHALYILNRDGPICPTADNTAQSVFIRSIFDSLVKKRRAPVEPTDDGPRYTALPEVR